LPNSEHANVAEGHIFNIVERNTIAQAAGNECEAMSYLENLPPFQ
jgi:hypothetical protein